MAAPRYAIITSSVERVAGTLMANTEYPSAFIYHLLRGRTDLLIVRDARDLHGMEVLGVETCVDWGRLSDRALERIGEAEELARLRADLFAKNNGAAPSFEDWLEREHLAWLESAR